MLKAPQPRSRLYTTKFAYAKAAAALLGYDYARGNGTADLERAIEELHPAHRAAAVPMARVGLYLTIKNLIRPGQKVILSPYTISDVVNMVLCAGGVPLFADIEPGGTFNIDAEIVADLLKKHDDVGAVVVTHFYGLICNIGPVLELCAKRKIPLIEDAAQSFGARFDGKAAGSMGHAGVFSFGLLKNVTGFLGGAVISRDAQLVDRIKAELRRFRPVPRTMLLKKLMSGASFDIATFPLVFDTSVYWLFRCAYLNDLDFFKNKLDTDRDPVAYASLPSLYSHRMSSAQARIILAQLARHEADSKERITKATLYYRGLKDLPGLILPPLREDGSHIYTYYPIQCDQRDKLGRAITQKLRDVQISHHRNCASLSCFSAYYRDCPHAERASRSVVYLPTYPGYRKDQVEANIQAIRQYFRESNSWT